MKSDKKKLRKLSRLGALVLLLASAACGGISGPMNAKTASMQQPPPQSAPAGGGHGDEASRPAEAAQGAPAPAPMSPPKKEARALDKDAGTDRPGLATHWGEARQSQIRTATFHRAVTDRPSAVSTLWYNDREGSRAMASSEGYRALDRAVVPMAENGVTISLRDEAGRPLTGYSAGGKMYAVGEPNTRYIIVLTNSTPARFETVVSVDGLDVIDGKPGSVDKRGYILHPNSSLEIEGFRQSESSVATFRFGSVRGSYADQKGSGRHVGVIGIALFHERGFQMWPWDAREVEQRKNADPFPGRFATPP